MNDALFPQHWRKRTSITHFWVLFLIVNRRTLETLVEKSFECRQHRSLMLILSKRTIKNSSDETSNWYSDFQKRWRDNKSYKILLFSFPIFISVFNSSSNLLKFSRTLKKNTFLASFTCTGRARTEVNKNINNILFIVIKNFKNMKQYSVFRGLVATRSN